MTPEDFSVLVAEFSLPIPWLAKHVGHVSERTFRYWACGRPGAQVNVPTDAVERMLRLNAAIAKALKETPQKRTAKELVSCK
jgi:hypothetical protein